MRKGVSNKNFDARLRDDLEGAVKRNVPKHINLF